MDERCGQNREMVRLPSVKQKVARGIRKGRKPTIKQSKKSDPLPLPPRWWKGRERADRDDARAATGLVTVEETTRKKMLASPRLRKNAKPMLSCQACRAEPSQAAPRHVQQYSTHESANIAAKMLTS